MRPRRGILVRVGVYGPFATGASRYGGIAKQGVTKPCRGLNLQGIDTRESALAHGVRANHTGPHLLLIFILLVLRTGSQVGGKVFVAKLL